MKTLIPPSTVGIPSNSLIFVFDTVMGHLASFGGVGGVEGEWKKLICNTLKL